MGPGGTGRRSSERVADEVAPALLGLGHDGADTVGLEKTLGCLAYATRTHEIVHVMLLRGCAVHSPLWLLNQNISKY
jgi:nicotinic acid phosphoribosyltransferase